MTGIDAYTVLAAVLGAAAGIIITVPVHELGHLAGGLIAGYRFSSVGMLGIYITRSKKGLTLMRRNDAPVGQCVMYPDDTGLSPILPITGGILADVLVGAALAAVGIFSGDIGRAAFFMAFGGMTAAPGILNAIPFSGTNDAATLKEVIRIDGAAELYNRLMRVYAELDAGVPVSRLADENLRLPALTSRRMYPLGHRHFSGSLIAEELRQYAQMKAECRETEYDCAAAENGKETACDN